MIEKQQQGLWKSRLKVLLSPADWSFGFKLGLVILLISVPTAFTSTFITVQSSLDRIRRAELGKLEQMATTVSGQITQAIASHQAMIDYLAREPRLVTLFADPKNMTLRGEVTGRLNTVVTTNKEAELLMAMDVNGEVLSSSDPDLVGRNFGFREYFQAARQGRNFMTSIIVGAVAGNSGVFFATPVSARSGEVVGVFVLKVRSQSYSQLIDQAAKGQRIHPFLVDSDGVIVYHADRNMLYKSLMPLDKRTQSMIAEDKRFRIEHVASLGLEGLSKALQTLSSQGNVRYSDPYGNGWIAGFYPVKGAGWTMVVSESQDVFSAPLKQQLNNFIVIMTGVSVIVLLLTLFVARLFVMPIRVMANAAQEVERGNYDLAKTALSSRDEVGQLSRAFDTMLIGVREREQVREVFGRMVSPEVREKLLEGTLKLGGEMARLSVLFSDIRDFSTLSEKMSPQEMVELLNEYLTEMSVAIKNWGGCINNFIGDSIVVVFGVPMPLEGIEQRAVFAALEMRERLNSLNKRRIAQGKEPLRNGVGISTGEMVAGQMGSLDRFLYSVIGDAVHVASHLDTVGRDFPQYPILINDATWKALPKRGGFESKDLGEHAIKGQEGRVRIWGIRPADV